MTPDPKQLASSGTKLKEVGKACILIGVVGPNGIRMAIPMVKDPLVQGLMMISTDLVALLFFVGLACYIIGARRIRQSGLDA